MDINKVAGLSKRLDAIEKKLADFQDGQRVERILVYCEDELTSESVLTSDGWKWSNIELSKESEPDNENDER